MATAGQRADTRLFFLDNLRTAMVFLVVLYHSGAVYESSGFFASFWVVDDPSTNDLVGIVNIVIDIFALPAIFFVSGYLAPRSLRTRPGWSFLTHRFRRLMIPWLVAVFTLVPLYKVIFLYSRGLPQEHWTTYFHFSNGGFSQSWLWFLPVLFLFDAVFWVLHKSGIRPPRISLGAAVATVFVLGSLWGFGVTVSGHTGWTKTVLLDFQNERLLIYFLVFLLGALCFRLGIFDAPPGRKGLLIAVACTAWIPMNVYMIVLLNLLFRPEQPFVSIPADLFVLWCAFLVSQLSMLYLLLAMFRRWLNSHGKLARGLGANSYAVYVLHVAVLGVLALPLLPADIPSLGKYVVLTLSTYVVCNVLVFGYRSVVRAISVAGPQQEVAL